MNNAVLVTYSTSVWSNVRKDKRAVKAVRERFNIKGKGGNFDKYLIESPLYKAILRARQYGRNVFYAYTLPWTHGTRICNVRALDVLIDEIDKAKAMLDDAVAAFTEAWPELVAKRQGDLGELFDASEYPDDIGFRFSIDLIVEPLHQDAHFDGIADIVGTEVAEGLAQTLAEQQTKQWKAAADDVWNRLYKALQHAHDKLAFGERIYDTDLGNLRELTDLLPILNINNDPKLEARRKELNSLLATYSTQAVKDKSTRQQCASEVNAILAKINL